MTARVELAAIDKQVNGSETEPEALAEFSFLLCRATLKADVKQIPANNRHQFTSFGG